MIFEEVEDGKCFKDDQDELFIKSHEDAAFSLDNLFHKEFEDYAQVFQTDIRFAGMTFEDVERGDPFTFGNYMYIKVNSLFAINKSTGAFVKIPSTTEVITVMVGVSDEDEDSDGSDEDAE